MSLTFGTGPFASSSDGAFNFDPPTGRVAYVEPWPRRMRAVFAGETVVDSNRSELLHETDAFPVHYYPLADLRGDLLVPVEPGRTWSLRVGDRVAEAAVTARPAGGDPVAEALRDHVTVDYAAMDRWFEEDEAIYAHPRDPYHRVDVRASSRYVVVRHDGRVVAESRRPKLLFETGNPIRYYLPFADVRIDLLERSDTVSECPYKGDGQHWHLDDGDTRVDDAAWSLPHPLPEGFAAAEHVCFYPDKVTVEVDGNPVTR